WTLTLQRGSPLTQGSTYPVVVSDALDLSGNQMGIPTNLSVRTFVATPGFAMRELYMNIGAAGTLAGLRAAPNFPDAPDQRDYVTLVEGPLDTFDAYGIRLTGFVLPQVSGEYNFFVSS